MSNLWDRLETSLKQLLIDLAEAEVDQKMGFTA